ncbi:MAG TPA: cyclophilin-like fold protein [Methylomirabilota bacterium]|nr:cyclophilin-like fold protein [Methylomirabilota bacterium]
MTKTLRIVAGSVSARATLDDSRTARAVWAALPIEAAAQTWGDEIYFPVPVNLPEDEAQAVVALGDLGYWPPGRAFCIFFGPTPASRGDECRPASPVNVFGRIDGDPTVFKAVRAGTPVRLERAEAGEPAAAHKASEVGPARQSGR